MKKRKGLSLVEVLIAFALIGILVLLVSGTVTSTYKTALAMQKLPGLYYKGQQGVENELDALEKKIKKKYLLEEEISASARPDPAAASQLRELDAELEEECEKVSLTLFGKDIFVYQFSREFVVENVGKINFCAGTASGVRLERPVPVIEKVDINPVGKTVTADISNAVGSTLTTTVAYSGINSEYHYTELYQWFVSTGNQHTVYYSDGTPGPDEMLHGAMMPVYPADFTLISSERTSTMNVTEDYVGRFVCCLVTPLSINGKMGDSVMSNLIYISNLPTGVTYSAVIDPSLMVLPYDASGKADVPTLSSMSAATGSFSASGGIPYVDLNGAVISEASGAVSRFLHFDTGDAMRSVGGLNAKANDKIFAVVRSDQKRLNFLSAGSDWYGFGNKSDISEQTEDGWYLLTITVNRGATNYSIGGGTFDIAELVFVTNPGRDATERVTNYLKNKYGIN